MKRINKLNFIGIYFIILKRIINNSSLKDVSSIFLSNAIGQFVFFLVTIFIANHFGKSVFGTINYAKTLSNYIFIIASYGFPQILAREIIQDKTNATKYISNSLLIRVSIGIILLFGFILYFSYTANNFVERTILILYAINGFLLCLDIAQSYDAFKKFRLNALIKIFSYYLVYFLIIIILIFFLKTNNIVLIVSSLVFSTFLYQLLNFGVFNKRVLKIKFEIEKNIILKLSKISFPFLLTNILGLIYMSFGLIWIQRKLGNDSTGIYSAAFSIISVLIIIDSSVSRILLPKIFELNLNNNFSVHKKQLAKYITIKLAYIFPFTVILFFFSGFIIHSIYSEQYQESIPVLQILSCWFFFQAFTPLATYIYGTRNTSIFLIFYFIKDLVLIVFVLILVKYFGIIGAAWALFLSNFATVILLFILVSNIMKGKRLLKTWIK